jgi:hypothetical protein
VVDKLKRTMSAMPCIMLGELLRVSACRCGIPYAQLIMFKDKSNTNLARHTLLAEYTV